MKSRDFCYWLQGYFEVHAKDSESRPDLHSDQVEVIKNHLNLVFAHEIDPEAGPKEVQDKLNYIHNSKKETIFRC